MPDNPLILYDEHGRPIDLSAGMPLPHSWTFDGFFSGSWHTYWLQRHDEAFRHHRENALAMMLDEHIQACLWERVRGTTSLKWHIEVDDDSDPWQRGVADGLTKLVNMTPRLKQYARWLLWNGLWTGRSANQMRLEFTQIDGDSFGPHRGLHCSAHRPVNGDKIGFRLDDVPVILVHGGYADDVPDADDQWTTEGRAIPLTGSWRERFCIHKVNATDVDFREGERADAVHGLGIRHWLYWSWWNKHEYVSAVIKTLDRIGLGLIIIKYDQSNAAAKTQAEAMSKNLSVDRSVITVPLPADRMGSSGNVVEVVNTPIAGAQVMLELQGACEAREERFIIAQTGSSRSETSGLGTHDNDFQQDTKHQLIEEDAGELAETLTGNEHEPGLLYVLKKYTYPWADFPTRFVYDVDPPNPEQKLGTVTMAWNLGVGFKKDELRALTGLSKPGPDDDVSVNPALQPGAGGQPGQQPGGPPGAQPTESPMGDDAEVDQTDSMFGNLYGESGKNGSPQMAGAGR